jgi:hypothetical protein
MSALWRPGRALSRSTRGTCFLPLTARSFIGTRLERFDEAASPVDFQGSQEDAQQMARAISGSDVQNLGVDDLTPVTAILRFRDRSGEERQIDFLRTVYGLETAMVRATAVQVELKDRADRPTGFRLQILHPVLCLVSRFHNTHAFLKYQGERGLRQARAAIGIACAYLQEQCDGGELRIAHNAIKIIGDLACSAEGRSVHTQFQLDAFEAIPNDVRVAEVCSSQAPSRL